MRRCDVGGGKVRILCLALANNLIGIYLTIRILETLFSIEECFPCFMPHRNFASLYLYLQNKHLNFQKNMSYSLRFS